MAGREYTEQEKANLEIARKWVEYYNTDSDRMVQEVYHPELVVKTMGAGTYTGHDHFLQVERDVLKAAPRRSFRLDHVHVDGDTVIVEVALLNPDMGDDWELYMAAVLVIEDGKIKYDRSFHNIGSEYPLWPGLENADPNKPAAANA
jgi:ketosteroid isomerase-like protein